MIQALEEETEEDEDEVVEGIQLTQGAPSTAVQPVNHIRPIRRSISVTESATMGSPREVHKDGGDMSLRPRFLQERSATIVHLTPQSVDPLRVPRSKASAFLMGVMAKSKGFETRSSSLEPVRANSIHYASQPGVERGMPLRMTGQSTRRLPVVLSDSVDKGIPEEARKHHVGANQEQIVAIVRELQANKQQIQQQLDILHSILRFINACERNDNGNRPVLKEMVDVGIIPELASIMREYRFNPDLQVCVMTVLLVLAEESPVNAYMMSEKTAVVHATQDRLVRLASSLINAIDGSKDTINIAAYHAEKAAIEHQKSSTYTGMLVAAIAANTRQLVSPSREKSSTVKQNGYRSSRLCSDQNGLEEKKFNAKQYGCRQQQIFALDVAPPALSANYHLLYSQKLEKAEVPPLPVPPDSYSNDPISIHDQQEIRSRSTSSLTRKSLLLDLTPRSLTAAIYTGGPIFVEPSPLSKRLPFRGSFSAAGVRRKLSIPRKIQRVHTERRPPTQNQASFNSDQPTRKGKTALMTSLAACVDEDNPVVSCTNEQDVSDLEDESYEDDFDTTGENLEGDKKTLTQIDFSQIASDGELMDLLHARAENSPQTFPRAEVDAATTIQRYARGTLARRKYAASSRVSSKCPTTSLGKTSRPTTGSKSEKRRSRSGGSTAKRIPVSAHVHRQFYSQGNNRRLPSAATTRLRPMTAMSTPSMQAKNKSKTPAQFVSSSVQSKKSNNQLLSPSRSPKLSEFSLSKQEFATTVAPEKGDDAEVVKELPDPKALKHIQTLYAEGLQHHKNNLLGLAIECYEKALVIPGAQTFASLHVNLGSALMAQSKFSEALESFEHAKRIQPNNIKAIYNYSVALLHMNRLHEAQQLVRFCLS
ncbi:hypothetical protein PHMEG_0007694 [Phytophthora megakarya]|uniref:Uncharacterized protein n=1 Tax=Phytophthora megakarya TaxID=4795 RepID=A0A225WKJ2_9STRA|nr:hypothetical protein PHMEG_0007694 [Phytophthora megakarya]